MAEGKRKTEDKIKEVEAKILSNSKDAHFAKNLIQQLTGLYQMDKEIDIAIKDVTDTLDLGGDCILKKCRQGYLFEAKGGMQTFVSWQMGKVCAMLNTLFEYAKDETGLDKTLYDTVSDAVKAIMLCPVHSALDERALFQNATAILNSYTEFCTENYTNAEAPDRTEADYKADADFENQSRALEELADAPLPPED